MTEYTPTTEEVRRCYGDIHCSDLNAGSLESHECPEEAEFDRWLAAHDAGVAAKALEDAADKFGENQMIREGDVKEWLRARAAEYRKGEER